AATAAGAASGGAPLEATRPFLKPVHVEKKDAAGGSTSTQAGGNAAISGPLRSLWTAQQIRIVHNIFLDIHTQHEQGNQSDVESYLESVERILRCQDRRIRDICAAAALAAAGSGITSVSTAAETSS